MNSRKVLLLMLFGLFAIGTPFAANRAETWKWNEPMIERVQSQSPPPPECGLFDICKGTPAS